jgi:hypothetical protein
MNFLQRAIGGVGGVLAFGAAVYVVLRSDCSAFPDGCYMSEDAWLYIPLIASVSGFVAQAIVVTIKPPSLVKTLLRSMVSHALAAFFVIRIWFLITGQSSGFAMPGLFDFAFFVGGAIMGGAVYVSRAKML